MDEDNEEINFPLWKTVAVVAVIIGSLGVTYPKFIHPMVLFMFGAHNQASPVVPEPVFPAQKPHGAPRRHGESFEPNRHHVPPPPPMFPGPAATGRSGKGVWSSLLPVYTIGVIVFLLYTVSKIIWKQPDRNVRFPEFHYNAESDGFEMGPSPPYRRDEKLLRGMSREELHSLHNRLTETETSLKRILKYLEQINDFSDSATAENLKFMTKNTLNDLEDICKKEVRHTSSSEALSNDQPEPYMQDLEAALSGFKQFTDSYMRAHHQTVESAAVTDLDVPQGEDSPDGLSRNFDYERVERKERKCFEQNPSGNHINHEGSFSNSPNGFFQSRALVTGDGSANELRIRKKNQ
ncbi:unnamed protein product [Soboliphyme baturini]|uniref:RIC3 domain-containing protein n=1 Tax=Soboliphyme baturini TaxID=241478 RepID=A0A183IQD1_9BILA|nr:unnamed protein product [Soboliphyme baturini]